MTAPHVSVVNCTGPADFYSTIAALMNHNISFTADTSDWRVFLEGIY